MKSNFAHNANGISISDSIIMSVRTKRWTLRVPIMVLIAVCGFTSVIMSFLGMFPLNYNRTALAVAASCFSAFYITLTLLNKKALWVYAFSAIVFAGTAYRYLDTIIEGFKFVYNVIYKCSFNTNNDYYKFVKHKNEYHDTTVLLIFTVWLLAIVIYYFTIYRPNPILPLLVTFPIIEIGLYNGIEIPIFWGMLVVAYWLALLAMSMIDVGEYDGGTGGFVRKDNLFFPKRKMKLKVTESCGIFIIASVMIVSAVSSAYIHFSGYERSDALNQKRHDITLAFDEFTFDDISGSLSRLGEALGFKVHSKSNKLGRNDSIDYDNVTDLIVEFAKPCNGAVYLKEEDLGVYEDNEWKSLEINDSLRKIMKECKEKSVYPQDFYKAFTKAIFPNKSINTINIIPQSDDERCFSPYGVIKNDNSEYYNDSTVRYKDPDNQKFKFYYTSSSDILDSLTQGYDSNKYYYPYEWDDSFYYDYDDEYYCLIDYYNSYEDVLASDFSLNTEVYVERDYRKYVYDNYLKVPDTPEINEVRDRYSSLFEGVTKYSSNLRKIKALQEIKKRMNKENTYTLSPGKTPLNRDFVKYFLMDNHKGYCVHFATAGVILARMAGIPARYATGYVIVQNDFSESSIQNDVYSIDVKDSRSHAWAEVYLDGFGWVPFEFTAGYSEQRIGEEPTTTTTAVTTTTQTTTAAVTTTQNITTASDTASSTLTTATDASAATAANTSSGSNNSSGFTIPHTVKVILCICSVILLLVAAVLLRRFIIISSRRNKFNKGTSSARLGYIYDHCERLLAYLKLNREHLTYTDFADKVEKRIGGTHFDRESFRYLMDVSLRSGFSNTDPDESEISKCIQTVDSLENSIYRNSGFFAKIKLKFIKVLL